MSYIFCKAYLWLFFLSCNLISIPDSSTADLDNFIKLHITKFPKFQLHDNSPLLFKNLNSYQSLIDAWQIKLNTGFQKFFDAVFEEFDLSREDVLEQLSNVKFVHYYHKIQSFKIELCDDTAIFIQEEDIDPFILKFIQNIIFSHTNKRNVRIVLTNVLDGLVATYGSDLYGHYVLCSIDHYSRKNIEMCYNSMLGRRKIASVSFNNDLMRCIDKANLMRFALIHAASGVHHQTELFVFWITHAKLYDEPLSPSTITLGLRLNYFLNMSYAILQSVNPLESALFCLRSWPQDSKDSKIWRSFFTQLFKSCSDESVKKFKYWWGKIKAESQD